MLKAFITGDEHAALTEADRAHYAVSGNGFLLQVQQVTASVDNVERVYNLADTRGLQNTINATRGERDEYQAELRQIKKRFDGINPDDARSAIEKVAGSARWSSEQAQAEAEARLRAELADELGGKAKAKVTAAETAQKAIEGRYDALLTQARKIVVDGKLDAAIAAVEGKAHMLRPALRDQVLVRINDDGTIAPEVVDADGKQRYSTSPDRSGQPMDIAELVATYKADPDWGAAFNGSGTSGGGTHQAGSVSGGVRTISRNDLEAMGQNVEGLANGSVVAV